MEIDPLQKKFAVGESFMRGGYRGGLIGSKNACQGRARGNSREPRDLEIDPTSWKLYEGRKNYKRRWQPGNTKITFTSLRRH